MIKGGLLPQLAIASILSFSLACGGADHNSGQTACGSDGSCPSGYMCNPSDNLCYQQGQTPPRASITASPAAVMSSTGASFSFTSDHAGSTFLCRVDHNGDFNPCTPPFSISVPDGSHTFEVIAVDPAGVRSDPATFTWTVDTTPPDTTIATGPPANANTSEAAFTFTSTEAGTFVCKIDTAAFAPCASGDNFTGLSLGSHTFSVAAVDVAGNTDPSPATRTWSVDTTTPETTITAKPTNPTKAVNASFSYTADKSGSTFECKLDNGNYGGCSSPSSYSLLAEGSHTFSVRATDPARNVDPTPATWTWVVDTTGPATTIASGPAASSTSAGAVTFTYTSEANATFECKLDSAAFAACAGTGQSYTLASGSHTFSVHALDTLGNVGPAATRTWTVDATAPTVTISAPTEGQLTTGSGSITFTVSETAAVTCRIDTQATVSNCASPLTFSLASGAHSVVITAVDGVGNSGSSTRNWTVDAIAPTVTISAPTAGQTTGGSVSVQFSASETVSAYSCLLDSATTYSTCASPLALALASGSHTIKIHARDTAGNVGADATRTWTVDATGPAVTISAPAAGATTGQNGTVTFSSEVGAVFQCSQDNGSFVACNSTSGFGFSGLSNGAHFVLIHATDTLGNLGPDARRDWNIDAVGPTMTIDPPSLGLGSVSLTFSGSETLSAVSCTLDGGASACALTGGTTGSASYSTLSAGAHSFSVIGTDAYGNPGSAAGTSFTISTGDGHLVLIGHDFAKRTADNQTLVGNAVALAPFAAKRPINVLGFNAGRADAGEIKNTQAAVDARLIALGMKWKYSEFNDPRDLSKALQGQDVLLVFDQQDPTGSMQDIGKMWGPTLQAFVKAGGVVIVCDGLASDLKTPSRTYEIPWIAGLLDVTSSAAIANGVSIGITAAGVNDRVRKDEADKYASMPNTVSFLVDTKQDPFTVIVYMFDSSLPAIIVHRTFRNG